MKLDLLTSPTVKAAIDALQKGDKNAWLALFTADATMMDDWPQSRGSFSLRHMGNFRTYFRFHLTSDGKISRLNVGQA